MPLAIGPFDVKLNPETVSESAANAGLGRYSLDKRFHGELDATSKGEMLSAGTAVKGSAGYVALERVDGVLQGRRGSFALQHSGTMARGEATLSVTVVPDSGTEELVGLHGSMSIKITEGKHTYQFNYGYALEPEQASGAAPAVASDAP